MEAIEDKYDREKPKHRGRYSDVYASSDSMYSSASSLSAVVSGFWSALRLKPIELASCTLVRS